MNIEQFKSFIQDATDEEFREIKYLIYLSEIEKLNSGRNASFEESKIRERIP